MSPPVNQCWEGGAELLEGVELRAQVQSGGQQDAHAPAISRKKKKKEKKKWLGD